MNELLVGMMLGLGVSYVVLCIANYTYRRRAKREQLEHEQIMAKVTALQETAATYNRMGMFKDAWQCREEAGAVLEKHKKTLEARSSRSN